jgi:electron transfer flavoprotein alpha subunit
VGAVLVHIDLDGDRLDRSSLSALAAGRTVATSWGATLYAALIVQGTPAARLAAEKHHAELGRHGADKVVLVTSPAPLAPLWSLLGGAWQAVLDQLRPRLVLFGADAPAAPELAPRTGARLGARLFVRARPIGGDDVELRDRDGGYLRSSDSGAAVVLVGGSHRTSPGDANVDIVTIAAIEPPDTRVELTSTSAIEVGDTTGVLIALDDAAAADAEVATGAASLAQLLGATLVGGPQAARDKVVATTNVIDRNAPLAPELCIAIGTPAIDLAGVTSLVRIGPITGVHGRGLDGALPAPIARSLQQLRDELEGSS